MVESGSALAIIGNHEYNAICYHTPSRDENFLREHSEKNIQQHIETLNAFISYAKEWDEFLEWFKRLPIFIELDNLRIVHAYWSEKNIDYLKHFYPENKFTNEFLIKSADKYSVEYRVIDELLKGPEVDLPGGNNFADKDGNKRDRARIKWWINNSSFTYNKLSFSDNLIDKEIPRSVLSKVEFYNEQNPPVFFGHYWLNHNPQITSNNSCCVDFSIAKGGNLVAYRWDGEQKLSNDKLVWVKVLED